MRIMMEKAGRRFFEQDIEVSDEGETSVLIKIGSEQVELCEVEARVLIRSIEMML